MKKNLSHIINVMIIPILFVITIWIIKGFEPEFTTIEIQDFFNRYGIFSRDIKKLSGIITFPFIHSNFSHLINNTYPVLILGGIIAVVYKTIANKVFLFSYLLSGMILWIIGNDKVPTIGASGIIYALASFVLVSGFIKNQPRLAMLSFLVIFLNLSNIWDIIPIELGDSVSRIGHLSGFIAGTIIAIYFRNKGPQEKKYNYELEEEIKQERKDIDINYIYKKDE